MVIDLLLDGLKNPTPAARIEMLRVLAMLEETRAVPTLRTLMTTEVDPAVLTVLKWAGSLIWRAQQGGYSTEVGMRQHFRVDLMPTEEQKKEEELLERMQYQFDMEMIKAKQQAATRKIGQKVLMGALGAALSGPMMSANMLLNSATSGMNEPSSGLEARPAIGSQTIVPQRPTNHDISIWLRRLKESDADMRKKVLIELRSLNNPAALPNLGYHFALDPDDAIKQEAQRCGKSIYFNWVHWAQEDSKAAITAQASQSEVAKILAKAEANREARKKK